MIDTCADTGTLETWSTPQCPFVVHYSRRPLDDIRLAVVDAFFSLPRGGAEIGGILLGKFEDGKLLILDYAPLDCEHALGPSFNLSPKDEGLLGQMLASAVKHPNGLRPVGWYHSHTRTEICLTDADLQIHNRYFPETWQVALVLRPSTFHATRAGFFFREADGSIFAQSTRQEFALEPLPIHAVPVSAPVASFPSDYMLETRGPVIPVTAEPLGDPAAPFPQTMLAAVAAAPVIFEPAAEPQVLPAAEAMEPHDFVATEPEVEARAYPDPAEARILEDVIAPAVADEHVAESSLFHVAAALSDSVIAPEPLIEAVAHPPVVPEPAAIPVFAETRTVAHPEPRDRGGEDSPAAVPIPSFTGPEPARSRRWMGIAALVIGGIAVVAVTSQNHGSSKVAPPKTVASAGTQPLAPLTLSLQTVDSQGQLQVRWDRNSPAVRQAQDAVLQLTDGGAASEIPLDLQHLQSGAFNYARQSERVDVKLAIRETGGRRTQEMTSFLGKLPEPVKPGRDDQAARKQNAELAKQSAELTKQNAAFTRQNAEMTKLVTDLRKQNTDLSAQQGDLRKQRDELTKQMAKLKADLGVQTAHAKQLQQQVDDLRKQQQKKRLSVQSNFDPLE